VSAALFRFEMQYVAWDNDPYYVRWWDEARPITVLAATKDDAVAKARDVLGKAPQGRFYAIRVLSITSHEIPT
jgi:hypothetical protein